MSVHLLSLLSIALRQNISASCWGRGGWGLGVRVGGWGVGGWGVGGGGGRVGSKFDRPGNYNRVRQTTMLQL